tara:strand:+ start:694 stop:882 length:189 start_codon:yes stop_codon:yes gene_type:complete
MTITNQDELEIVLRALSRHVDALRNDMEAGFTPITTNILKDDLKISERILKRLRKEIQSRAA